MCYAQASMLEPKDGSELQPLYSGVLGLRFTVDSLKEKFKTDNVTIAIEGTGNFREKVAVSRPYKGGRTSPKPTWFYELRDVMIEDMGAIVINGEETDDYLSYTSSKDPDNTVTVTVDKDAMNTSGYYYNPRRSELAYVDEDTANYNFWSQMLVGDTIDNIAGLPYYGAGKVQDLLRVGMSYAQMEEVVGLHYAMSKHLPDPEAYMTEQGQLLWMRREPEQMWRIGMYTKEDCSLIVNTEEK